MEEINITPAPWTFEKEFKCITGADGETIALVCLGGESSPNERQLHDAALIAAAPRLLRFLSHVLMQSNLAKTEKEKAEALSGLGEIAHTWMVLFQAEVNPKTPS